MKNTINEKYILRLIEIIKATIDKDKRGQSLFAERCGIPPSTLNRYIKQGQFPKPEYLIPISEASGYHITWLLTGNGPKRITDQVQEEKVHSDCFQEVAELQEWLAEISEEDPDRRVWFKMELKDNFPLFKEWLKKRDQTNTETGNRRAA